MTSSSASLTCRIDWRPSRLLQGTLLALGGLAALSLWLSALPRPLAWLTMPVVGLVAWRQVQALGRQPACELLWKGGAGEVSVVVDGREQAWTAPRAAFRGPLASVSGLDASGRRRHLLWWPDTLDASARRRLRLAASVDAVADDGIDATPTLLRH